MEGDFHGLETQECEPFMWLGCCMACPLTDGSPWQGLEVSAWLPRSFKNIRDITCKACTLTPGRPSAGLSLRGEAGRGRPSDMATGEAADVAVELQERFQRAAERIRSNTSLRPTDGQKLELYSLYKQVLIVYSSVTSWKYDFTFFSPLQAVTGACNTSKPGFFDFTGRAKW